MTIYAMGVVCLLYCIRVCNWECVWLFFSFFFFLLVGREQDLGFFSASVKLCHLSQIKDILIAS